jgi:hypothetical protein
LLTTLITELLLATALSFSSSTPLPQEVLVSSALTVGQYDHLPVVAPALQPEPPPKPTPKEYLKSKVSEREYKILHLIAQCESEWKNIPNHLYDGENGRYTAYGPFQILKSTARGYSKEDRREVYTNIDIAIAIYRKEGTTPWNESKYCWNK